MKTLSSGLGVILVVVAAVACGADPGTLVITVDPLPALVKSANILVTGSVSRTPEKTTDIIISVAGGALAAADTFRGSTYSILVFLNPNATNSLAVTATDVTGSTANSVFLTVRQDGQGPNVAQVTPADTADNVPVAAPISVTFTEPVVLAPGGGIRLTRQGGLITGTTTASPDSLTLTFAPAAPLSPNAIYRLAFSGISDVATNSTAVNAGSCFVTTPAGATATASFNDSPNDTIYSNNGPDALLPPNLVSARFAREGALFSGVIRYSGPRVFSATALNQGGVILELDIDEDSTTGFRTIKDTLFNGSTSLGPTYSSGTQTEFIIDLEVIPEANDSAFIGPKQGTFTAGIQGTFLPGICGAQWGFVVPFSLLGNDDGKMNAVLLGLASTTSTIRVDPMPTRGNLALDLRVPGPAPVWSGPAFIAEQAQLRLVRHRPRPPLR